MSETNEKRLQEVRLKMVSLRLEIASRDAELKELAREELRLEFGPKDCSVLVTQ
jgi:hypothetical protein